MIVIYKSAVDKQAINISFDINGAKVFKDTLKKLLDQSCSLEIEAINKEAKISEKYLLSMSISYDDEIRFKKRIQSLYLSRDTCEYGIYLLNQYMENGFFYPAEFCEFTDQKTHKNKMIYFESINGSKKTGNERCRSTNKTREHSGKKCPFNSS